MKENENKIKDVTTEIEYKNKTYHLVFNLNVMQEIQEEYGTIEKWGALTDGTNGEVNIKALIFGFTRMLNEGIEIENEENGENATQYKPFTEKQVGRMITEIGLENMTKRLTETVIESTKSDNQQKNV